MDLIFYPVNDFGPLMKGLVIGGMGIFHVFLAQFAIGGGLLMCYFQWLASTGREPAARRLVDSFFRFLVLISFVVGALTGVGMWFTTIQISPRTIGVMVEEFHWIWAIEWTFFWLEVVAGYTFYRCALRLGDRDRMRLLLLYTLAAWASLFWINGILSWQLTPGRWVESRNVWSGFFNPSFWPSLLYRTASCMAIAGLVGCAVINAMPNLSSATRTALIHRTARFLLPMAAMPALGIWYLAVVPPDSRAWVLGGSVAMTMFMMLAVGASLLIGLYALIAILWQRLTINGATATLLAALAFVASAGGEFVREGIRKPYTIRNVLLSNSIPPERIAELRRTGAASRDPYPLRDATPLPTDQLRLGALTFRLQCSICHTLDGVNGLVPLTASWAAEQKRVNIAHLQHLKTFMPPFAGSARELEALVQFIGWQAEGAPAAWPESENRAAEERIRRYLDEAGVLPAVGTIRTGER